MKYNIGEILTLISFFLILACIIIFGIFVIYFMITDTIDYSFTELSFNGTAVRLLIIIVFCVILALSISSRGIMAQDTITPEVRFTPTQTETGFLTEGYYEMYSFDVDEDASKITLILNGPSTGDFDLYANYNSDAEPGGSEYSSEG